MTAQEERDGIRVVPLSEAPGEKTSWGRPGALVYLWGAAELLFVSNPWQISSRLRVAALRAFGARIGEGVIIRPRTRVRFPWKLRVGDGSWIGEGVWFHNQDLVDVGRDVVVSQDTFVTTGSHRHRTDMGLVTAPVRIRDGSWVTARCVVLGGTDIGRSALVAPASVVRGQVPDGRVWEGRALTERRRF